MRVVQPPGVQEACLRDVSDMIRCAVAVCVCVCSTCHLDAATLRSCPFLLVSLPSYDLGREPTPPISEPRPGDLCCARYHDNKWYRARVESIPQSGKVTFNSSTSISTACYNNCFYSPSFFPVDLSQVKVFLVDFGSILHTSTNELIPLKEKYRQYPFQVLLCALSEESITLPREVIEECDCHMIALSLMYFFMITLSLHCHIVSLSLLSI